MHFLGLVPTSRVDQTTYHQFKKIIDKAKKNIENEMNGEFRKNGEEKFGSTRYPIFKFEKVQKQLNGFK